MKEYTVKKIVNNNVVLAFTKEEDEVILLGRGVGFGKQPNDVISEKQVDKLFERTTAKGYQNDKVEGKLAVVMGDIISKIEVKCGVTISKEAQSQLFDHLSFALWRVDQGILIFNPVMTETKLMYPDEYEMAKKVILYINDTFKVQLPKDEIGFVANHIHRAITKETNTVANSPQLIQELMTQIEKGLQIKLEKRTDQFRAVVLFLQQIIQRCQQTKNQTNDVILEKVLKENYPVCYNTTCLVAEHLHISLHQNVTPMMLSDLTLYLHHAFANRI
ncbi:PRD domain-containing protein [Alkalihalobacillus sp. LMS39]|uniref:PRD domain-containing protein n=1 Tax=Alkalihalobacillus sp. LMS39 TaxID=2924032 RepID=UPI001FB1FCFD|nr:PRD domain-containing protein [Alkalihalobacillus sp. LMS39]UOE93365.1 PRD domain-containing protein [Alkalihalobacillus sp. LMS39]